MRAELPEIINVVSLSNTLLIPSLSINLISQSKLEQYFYTNTKEDYQVRDRESDDLIFDARMVGKLYILNQEREFDTALLAKKTLHLWYERLGHINIQRLKTMRDKSAKGVQFTDTELSQFHYEPCILDKAHRKAILNHQHISKKCKPGEILH